MSNQKLLEAMQQNGNLIVANVGDLAFVTIAPKPRPDLKPFLTSKVIGNELHVRQYTDPGHAWLAVPVKWLEALGIADQITRFSFVSKARRTAYLEEDSDASLFIRTARQLGFIVFIDERHTDRVSPIRSYISFPG